MEEQFVNRLEELARLRKLSSSGGLIVLFGRRRVGKSRLLLEWLKSENGIYTQAIEGSSAIQLQQIFEDLKGALNTEIVPKTWTELFELVSRVKSKVVLCIDEFPYLVQSDPNLPSQFQRWLDRLSDRRVTLVLSGSSIRMMNQTFLNPSAPLYGRAKQIMQIRPMSYENFCQARKLAPDSKESFLKFALVGGIPKYWEFVDRKMSALETAESLYFGFAPYMQMEPRRILSDERLDDLNPLSVLQLIGRGAHKASEIASRLGTKQTNLSRVFQQLIDSDIIRRDVPYSESQNSSKRTLYSIVDPALRFWFQIFSPHQTRWRSYTKRERLLLLNLHASTVFEDYCRTLHPGAGRYWEGEAEIDLIAKTKSGLLVGEVKWASLDKNQITQYEKQLEERFLSTKFGRSARVKSKKIVYRVYDQSVLG